MSVTSIAFPLFVITLVAGIALLFVPNRKVKTAGKLLLGIPLALVLSIVWFLIALITSMISVYGLWYFGTASIILLAVYLAIMFSMFRATRRKWFYIPLLVAFVGCVIVGGSISGYEGYIRSIATVGEPSDMFWRYNPKNEDNKLARLSQPSTLTFSLTEELPYLDGATALYPIYSAFVHATYPPERLAISDEYLMCRKTPEAYTNLIDGNSDLIFVAGPSDKQLEEAAAAGVELVLTPIGKEAFVFFVNAKNPIESLTVEQIQGIYSGEIKSWKELGCNLGDIRAFQRPEGSGSQTALQRLMEGKSLVTPPTENVVGGMGGIIEKVSDYRNFKDAIGYSFRFYSTEMVQNNEIKLLAVNGVAPTKENILNGSYPIVSDIYAVTRADASPETKRLVEWVLSEQGQELIDRTGYVALK